MRLRTLAREPFLHFLLLGGALFAVHGWFFGDPRGSGEQIVLTRGHVEQLVNGFERVRQRAPDPGEVDALIDDAIREEIFYREARALGLDEDDSIVRRRLRQKLEFLTEDVVQIVEPDDADLQAWREAHPDRFRAEARYSVSQVYLDPQKHGEQLAQDAATILASLQDDAVDDRSGDAFLLPSQFDGIGSDEVTRLFGQRFEAALRDAPVGTWHGPVTSGYGMHLIRVAARDAGGVRPLAEIRDAVRADWIEAQRAQANARYYDQLRSRYQVTVERDVSDAGGSPPLAASSAR